MKRLGLILGFVMLTITSTIAQRNNISPKIQAERDMMAIERKMQQANTDEEGVKLIKAHLLEKRKMDGTMKKIPGYGKAATDKASLIKFREKNAKKDPSFKKLSDNEKTARLAKESYISGVNEEYTKHKKVSLTK